jgi:hypothetical protein
MPPTFSALAFLRRGLAFLFRLACTAILLVILHIIAVTGMPPCPVFSVEMGPGKPFAQTGLELQSFKSPFPE